MFELVHSKNNAFYNIIFLNSETPTQTYMLKYPKLNKAETGLPKPIDVRIKRDNYNLWKDSGNPLYLLEYADGGIPFNQAHYEIFWKVDLELKYDDKATIIFKKELGREYILRHYLETGLMFHDYYENCYLYNDNPVMTGKIIKDCIELNIDF